MPMDSSTALHMEDIQDGVMPRQGERSSQGADSWQDKQEEGITIIESLHYGYC